MHRRPSSLPGICHSRRAGIAPGKSAQKPNLTSKALLSYNACRTQPCRDLHAVTAEMGRVSCSVPPQLHPFSLVACFSRSGWAKHLYKRQSRFKSRTLPGAVRSAFKGHCSLCITDSQLRLCEVYASSICDPPRTSVQLLSHAACGRLLPESLDQVVSEA